MLFFFNFFDFILKLNLFEVKSIDLLSHYHIIKEAQSCAQCLGQLSRSEGLLIRLLIVEAFVELLDKS